jgi:hypothetical protein
VHSTGSPLVVGDATALVKLASFNITSSSATPAAGSPFHNLVASASCAFSRDGNYFYTGGYSGTKIAGFSVNAGTGVLTPSQALPLTPGHHGQQPTQPTAPVACLRHTVLTIKSGSSPPAAGCPARS